MRFAFILVAALVSHVFLPTDTAEARPRASQVSAAKKSTKKRAPKAKAKAVSTKKVAAKHVDEEVAATDDAEAKPAPAPVTRRAVAQTTDDEVPRNEPKKQKR